MTANEINRVDRSENARKLMLLRENPGWYGSGTRYDASKSVKVFKGDVYGASITVSMTGDINFLYPNSIVQAKINYHRGGSHCTVDFTDPTEPWLHESFGEFTIYHKTRVTIVEAIDVWMGLKALITNQNNC